MLSLTFFRALLITITLLCLLSFSPSSYAWTIIERYDSACYTNPDYSLYEPGCLSSARSAVVSQCMSHMSATTSYRAYSVDVSVLHPGGDAEKTTVYCDALFQSFGTDVDLGGLEAVYNLIYSDEQCQAQYGTASILITEGSSGPYNAGACSLTLAPGSVGVCTFYDNQGNPAPDGSCYMYGDFIATSTGETNTPGGAGADPNPETPDYLTETTDPASCPAGSVSYGGTSYCVDQSAIDDGSISIIGGGDGSDPGGDSGTDGGIDWGDTPSDSTPGTSTGPDGDPLGMGEGDPDGDGEGDSTLGDIVAAINGLKNTMRNGFDGLVEKLTQNQDDNIQQFADAAPSQADYEAEFGSREDHTAEAVSKLDAIEGELTGLIDGSDSEFQGWYDTLGGYFAGYFPMMPAPSCSPLVFAQGTPYSFTIDCSVFERIRSALAWILGVFTVWVVISTMFTARPH